MRRILKNPKYFETAIMEFSVTSQVFGWLAISLSLIYKLPQIWKLHKNGDIRGISLSSQMIQTISYFFYIVHGVLIKDPPVTVLGSVSLTQSIILLCQYFYYRKRLILPVNIELSIDKKELASEMPDNS